jgi:hypothetical protein
VGAEATRRAVHDWLTGMRGGEKALEVLADVYPEADTTLLYRRNSPRASTSTRSGRRF